MQDNKAPLGLENDQQLEAAGKHVRHMCILQVVSKLGRLIPFRFLVRSSPTI